MARCGGGMLVLRASDARVLASTPSAHLKLCPLTKALQNTEIRSVTPVCVKHTAGKKQ